MVHLSVAATVSAVALAPFGPAAGVADEPDVGGVPALPPLPGAASEPAPAPSAGLVLAGASWRPLLVPLPLPDDLRLADAGPARTTTNERR